MSNNATNPESDRVTEDEFPALAWLGSQLEAAGFFRDPASFGPGLPPEPCDHGDDCPDHLEEMRSYEIRLQASEARANAQLTELGF